MRQKYKKCGNTVVLSLSGYIISNDDMAAYDYFEMDATAPRDIEAALELAAGGIVTVEIDSPGGDLFAGTAMYTAMMSYSGEIKFIIRSLAGSAATIAAMASAKAGNRCEMSPVALMFIHNVKGSAEGDYRDMAATADMLKTANKTAIAAYKLKTGMEESALQELMDAGTWFSAEEALKAGLIDGILFEATETPSTVKSLANTLVTASGKLMNFIAQMPQRSPAVSSSDNEKIACAQAALAIEQNRY